MKYLYINSKFVREDKAIEFPSPLTNFVDTPVLHFSTEAKAKTGTLDLSTSTEYLHPIQMDEVIMKELIFFREEVDFIPYSYGLSSFYKSNLQYLLVDKRYNPIKYNWHDVEFHYILACNLEYFLNTIIPLIRWGAVYRQNDIDLILFFSILLCKRQKLEDKKGFKHSYPYLSKFFLNNITVKQNFEFQSRVGRDDHAYEYTHLIYEFKEYEEYYFLRLLSKEFAEKNFSPLIQEKRSGKIVDISYCSMFDNNAFREPDRDYSEEVCNTYKKMLIEKHNDLYNSFFSKFVSLFEEFMSYQKRKRYSESEYEATIRYLRKEKEDLNAKIQLYKETMMKQHIALPD